MADVKLNDIWLSIETDSIITLRLNQVCCIFSGAKVMVVCAVGT